MPTGIPFLDNLVNSAQANPQVQQAENGPLGMLLQGKFNKIGPSAYKVLQDTLTGKTHPQVFFGGEMEVPGAGLAEGAINQGGKSPVRITLKPGVYGAGREAKVQSTVDNIIPGNTATEKYNNLAPTMQGIGSKIDTILAQNPKTASLNQVMQDYDTNLREQGIYRVSNLPKTTVQKTARQYVTDLYNEANGGTNNINPKFISDSSLLKLKQQANQDAQSVYRKIENGTSLTDKDQVILAARQTFDDTLSTLHPEVKSLTTTQSHLYDAADSLYKAREGEFKSAQQEEQASGNSLLSKLLYQAQKHPAGAIATGLGVGPILQEGVKGAIPAAETGMSALMNKLNGSGQTPTHSGLLQNILGTKPASSPQANGQQPSGSQQQTKYNVADPMQSGLLMNQNDYSTQKGSLQKQLDYENQYKLPTAGITQGKLDSLNTTYESQQPLRDKWSNPQNTGVAQQITVANKAAKAVDSADPGFFNALQSGYDKLQTASNGKYAQMSKYLQYLGTLTGTDFRIYKTKDALQGAIDAAAQNITDNWNTQLKSYYGANSVSSGGIPQGPAGNTTSAGNMQAPQEGIKAFAPGFNFGKQL